MAEHLESIEGIMAQHERLLGRIAGLEGFLKMPRPEPRAPGAEAWAGELSERLGELRELLVVRFRTEETTGTMQELALSQPRAAPAIQGLIGDHRRLLERLRTILGGAQEYADGEEPAQVRLRANTRRLLQSLARHEQAEDSLLQRLHHRDLGAGSSAE